MGLSLPILFLSIPLNCHCFKTVLIFTLKAHVASDRKFMDVKDQFQWYANQTPDYKIEVFFPKN